MPRKSQDMRKIKEVKILQSFPWNSKGLTVFCLTSSHFIVPFWQTDCSTGFQLWNNCRKYSLYGSNTCKLHFINQVYELKSKMRTRFTAKLFSETGEKTSTEDFVNIIFFIRIYFKYWWLCKTSVYKNKISLEIKLRKKFRNKKRASR